jgi:hypothetical protein
VASDLASLIEQAVKLRAGCSLPAVDAGPQEVHQSLLTVRSALDRVDEIFRQVILLRGKTRRAKVDADLTLDVSWAETSSRQRAKGIPEYSSARERQSDVDLSVLEQRRAATAARHSLEKAQDAFDVVKLERDALDGIRRDHHSILAAMRSESSLER